MLENVQIIKIKRVKGEWRNKNREDRKQITDLNPTKSYIHVNSLNIPKWIKTQDTTISCFKKL